MSLYFNFCAISSYRPFSWKVVLEGHLKIDNKDIFWKVALNFAIVSIFVHFGLCNWDFLDYKEATAKNETSPLIQCQSLALSICTKKALISGHFDKWFFYRSRMDFQFF